MAKIQVKQHDRWTHDASYALAVATGDDEQAIAADVDHGLCCLYEFDGGNAWGVVRLDGSEFVVMCFEGKNLHRYCPLLIETAKACGAQSLRFHSKRRALGRMVRKFGITEKETIYSMELN